MIVVLYGFGRGKNIMKNKLKHTPAPWELKRDGWNGQYVYGNDERVLNKKRYIADVDLNYDGAEANARLITAAPEMIDKHITEYIWLVKLWNCDFINERPDIFNKIIFDKKEVIEKATGLKIEDIL